MYKINDVIVKKRVSEIILDIPKFQRMTDMNRVDDIFESMKKDILTTQKICMAGCLIFAKSNTKTWIIDGLHRIEVYKRIHKELGVDLFVNCNEIYVDNEDEARILFYKVNDSRPLPDMPEGSDTSILKTVVTFLMSNYPQIFSNSKTGRICRPHLNFNGLQEALAVVVNIPSNAIELIEQMNNEVNTFGFEKYLGNEDVKSLMSTASSKGGFFLGIIPGYRWVNILFLNSSPLLLPYKKKAIPQRLRMQVWNNFIGDSIVGKCYICTTNQIRIDSFHCGHDIPESKGGQPILSNLKPICAQCNLSMGTMTMIEMKHKFN